MKKYRLLGIILIVLGTILYTTTIFNSNRKTIYEKNKINYTLSSIANYKYPTKDIYNAVIKIPKIGLKMGIYSINDSRNNINNTVMIDKNSIYPDNDKSNIILIAHSGIGPKAFFNKLELLDTNSLVEFYYQHNKYVYKIDHYYYVEKTGKVRLDYDSTKKTITLITCSSNNRQVVYIGYLIDKINY